MSRLRVTSNSPYEARMGFSRAVRVGGHVYVSQTAPIPQDGGDPPADTYGQARQALATIAAALAEVGASLKDVVCTRVYLMPRAQYEEVARAHHEVFGSIRPANTCISCAMPEHEGRFLVEIEAEAIIEEASG